MTLSWTMDKLGPMCRSAEDCALVFHHIHGSDGADPTVRDVPFRWRPELKPSGVRLGYVEEAFARDEKEYPNRKFDLATLEALRALGYRLVPVRLPEAEYNAMRIILTAEAAAAFDELTRSGRDRMLSRQDRDAWPNTFRRARFIPAVEYINANRIRTLAMQRWAALFEEVDVIVTPTGAGMQLVATNLTGHPAVIVPNGFNDDGTPVSITFLGGLYRDDVLLSVASAYQSATDFAQRRPELDRHLKP